ncbi:hypothetical protein C9374_006085 [Naegleria lovaniensis]|uniref:PITH domain-containing protein n=1 Tax=Naegleria lovaniensis TaxID=51637 RepID=A0AA88GM73_NAELO|nr:uncharacterized protein C9374_006085 [Naegleria lovaniensis]KAG2381701.1 hypothetical protein C9374_006085 [Naegleria lovaniensis]
MGVPFFFYWLLQECPEMIREVVPSSSLDSKQENKFPIDHLFLDLNGIIHTFKDCNLQTKVLDKLFQTSSNTHQKDSEQKSDASSSDPSTHEEDTTLELTFERFILSIMLYIEEIVYRFPPCKTLYFALDGVAPAAKINQQRERRWVSFKNSTGLPKRRTTAHSTVGASSKEDALLDSISITSGTSFMKQLSEHLQFFIKRKLQDDQHWRSIENIVFSDSSVPGEGEHKIIAHIRELQKSKTNVNTSVNSNEKFMIYGMDSDLIFLALTTHEEQFYILRDWTSSVQLNSQQLYHNWRIKRRLKKAKGYDKDRFDHKFHVVDISVVRKLISDYMKNQEDKSSPPVEFDLNRVIDDFVLMLFLCGNDFVTALPTLDIGKEENALGYLFKVYRSLFTTVFKFQYISDTSNTSKLIDLDKLELFIQVIGKLEVRVLTNRLKRELDLLNQKKKIEEEKKKKKEEKEPKAGHTDDSDLELVSSSVNPEHYKNLLSMIDLNNLMCLNATQDLKQFLLLSSITKSVSGTFTSQYVVKSTIDSEIMFDIQFKQPLSLCSLILRIGNSAQQLNGMVVKLFVNQNVDFVAMETHKVAQEFSSTDLLNALETCELKLKLNAFQNVSRLSIIVENVIQKTQTTTIDQLVLFGNVSTKTGSKLVKVSKKSWKKKDYSHQKKHNISFEMSQEEERVKKFKVITNSISLKKKEGMPPPPYVDIEKWKTNYYKKKMNIVYDHAVEGGGEQVKHLVSEYVRALFWIFHYYYFGVPSWEWAYQCHYAPCASDFKHLKELFKDGVVNFQKGRPFNDVEGLLAVLPLSRISLVEECLNEKQRHRLRFGLSSATSPLHSLFYTTTTDSEHPVQPIEDVIEIDPNDEGLKTSLNDPFYHYSRMVVHLPIVEVKEIRKIVDDILNVHEGHETNVEPPNILVLKWDDKASPTTSIPSTISVLPKIENSKVTLTRIPFENDNNEVIKLNL